MSSLKYIKVEHLLPNERNPRKALGDLTELTDSIRESGIFQNLTVVPWEMAHEKEEDEEKALHRDDYTVIIGHRRLAAAQAAGLTALPCIVACMSEEEQFATMMLENLQRADLTVYEQAEGFQLMMDMGETVESIKKKTGVSETTVRRRLKMAELDGEKLREAAGRQVTMAEFDKLARVEDVEVRNQLLDSIGTGNFNYRLLDAMQKQTSRKNLPLLKAAAEKAGMQKIKTQDQYDDRKYKFLKCIDMRQEMDMESLIPEDAEAYCCNNEYFSFYKVKAVKEKTEEETEREKEIKAEKEKKEKQWKELENLAANFYELRWNFADSIRLTKDTEKDLLREAATAIFMAGMGKAGSYSHMEDAFDCSGSDKEEIADKAEEIRAEDLPRAIYALYGDSEKKAPITADWEIGNQVHYNDIAYQRDIGLEQLYCYLQTFGYKLADEEKAFLDGTHRVYGHGTK